MQSTRYYSLVCEIFMVTIVLCKHTKLFRETPKEESNLFEENNIFALWNSYYEMYYKIQKSRFFKMTFKIPKTLEMILNFISSTSFLR